VLAIFEKWGHLSPDQKWRSSNLYMYKLDSHFAEISWSYTTLKTVFLWLTDRDDRKYRGHFWLHIIYHYSLSQIHCNRVCLVVQIALLLLVIFFLYHVITKFQPSIPRIYYSSTFKPTLLSIITIFTTSSHNTADDVAVAYGFIRSLNESLTIDNRENHSDETWNGQWPSFPLSCNTGLQRI